jgi:hypothetical protein
VALTATDDPAIADEDASDELGAPAVWAAGGQLGLRPEDAARFRRQWQTFATWFSRPVNQAQLASEALGLRPPPPYMTQDDATRDLLLGTRTRPVVAEDEVVRRFMQSKEAELRNAEETIRVPRGIGPR